MWQLSCSCNSYFICTKKITPCEVGMSNTNSSGIYFSDSKIDKLGVLHINMLLFVHLERLGKITFKELERGGRQAVSFSTR